MKNVGSSEIKLTYVEHCVYIWALLSAFSGPLNFYVNALAVVLMGAILLSFFAMWTAMWCNRKKVDFTLRDTVPVKMFTYWFCRLFLGGAISYCFFVNSQVVSEIAKNSFFIFVIGTLVSSLFFGFVQCKFKDVIKT